MMYQRFKDDMSVMIVNYIFLVMIFYLIASVTFVKVYNTHTVCWPYVKIEICG